MPMPRPGKNEEQQAFISRCMGSEAMLEEFPDQKQRAAVCYDIWRDHHGEADTDGKS